MGFGRVTRATAYLQPQCHDQGHPRVPLIPALSYTLGTLMEFVETHHYVPMIVVEDFNGDLSHSQNPRFPKYLKRALDPYLNKTDSIPTNQNGIIIDHVFTRGVDVNTPQYLSFSIHCPLEGGTGDPPGGGTLTAVALIPVKTVAMGSGSNTDQWLSPPTAPSSATRLQIPTVATSKRPGRRTASSPGGDGQTSGGPDQGSRANKLPPLFRGRTVQDADREGQGTSMTPDPAVVYCEGCRVLRIHEIHEESKIHLSCVQGARGGPPPLAPPDLHAALDQPGAVDAVLSHMARRPEFAAAVLDGSLFRMPVDVAMYGVSGEAATSAPVLSPEEER
ncbi:hypothetical protein HPB47_021341 [Ixodes persulcatus]|uniref:Uncharacterized protein n=1 Tax=Ixodes persulcatus TaxID=34615 RepID=A0AC60QCV4_IXOPE|nr:hypothetical protein HPB47_021341 [Ixodes persulcatus]